ncbi:MAG TPA: preprotein translocase subunit YajC [Mucilaginibacter sp.]
MIATILLQAGTGFGTQPIIMFGLIAIVFYFFMIRPQVKKSKDQKKYVNELKKGDKVVTTAGIHGKIADITDAYFLVEVDNGVKIRFDKSAISLEASKALNTPPVTTK